MKKLKLYLDTSVWNFYYADDAPEKRDATKQFFENLRAGIYEIYSSVVVIREIENADEATMTRLASLMNHYAPILLELNEEIDAMADIYLDAGIVPLKKRDDALHIAVSTFHEMDALIIQAPCQP